MEWKTTPGLVAYEDSLAFMEQRIARLAEGSAGEMVWLLEHPPLYTAGTSARDSDLLDARFPVFKTGRGGQYTYHGPGQRIAYVMLDLNNRGRDIRRYVQQLEQWIIATLKEFGVQGFTREGRVGVWVNTRSQKEAKIAALGVRVRKWITYHGIALNVSPDLSHYAGIVPCGISEFGITSLQALGIDATMEQVDSALTRQFHLTFAKDGK